MELMIFIAGAFSGAVITGISIGAMMKEDKVEVVQDFTIQRVNESEIVKEIKQKVSEKAKEIPLYVEEQLREWANVENASYAIIRCGTPERKKLAENYLNAKGIRHVNAATYNSVKVPMEQFYE